MKILDGKKLKSIVNLHKKIAEVNMPLILDMLVKADSSNGSYSKITKNDDVALSGLDGRVTKNTKESRYVPLGDSYWEIGTGKDFCKKVYGDFKKRNDNDDLPKDNVTFISITCTTPLEKSRLTLINQIKKTSKFKDFLIYDATDLANWLNAHLNILLKFFEIFDMANSLAGIELLKTYWENFSNSTNPNINQDFILYHNNNLSDKIIEDLKSGIFSKNIIKHISSKRYGVRFGFLFVCASILNSKDEDLIDKTLIVRNQDCLDFLLLNSENLILLLDFNCFDLKLGSGVNNTIVVFTNYNDGDFIKTLNHLQFIEATKALGVSEEEANRLSNLSGYNYSSLIRRITINPMLKRPPWVYEKNKHELVPLMLLGSIDTSNKEIISLLKDIISVDIDDYINHLIIWGDLGDSPVAIEDYQYEPSCRNELFDYINIDINNTKLRKIEEYLINSIIKGLDNEIIYRVIDGLMLLNNKGYFWENHFLKLSFDLIGRLEKETCLKLAFNRAVYKFSMLSPSIFIKYLIKIINSEDPSVLSSIMSKGPNSWDGSNQSRYYLVMCLERLLIKKELATEALELLLVLFDKTKDKFVEGEIKKVFSPLSSVFGITITSARSKTNILFSHLDSINDDDYYYDIISCFSKGGNDSFCLSIGPDSIDYSLYSQSVPYSDVFLLENKSIDWLFDHAKGEKMSETIEEILNNLYYCDDAGGKDILAKISKFIDDSNGDNSKLAIINKKILTIISHITKYNKGERIEKYSDELHSLYKKSIPTDLMFRYKYIFEFNDFPIDDSTRLTDDDWYEKDEKKRELVRQKAIQILFENYKEEEVIVYLVSVCKEHAYAIWDVVFSISTDKLRDCRLFVANNKHSALERYFCKLDILSIKEFVEEMDEQNLDFVISCLPLNQAIINFVSDTIYEKAFWENCDYYRSTDVSEEVLFEKFLKYNPLKLLSPYAYIIKNKTYDKGIRLLRAIIRTKQQGFFEDEHYALDHIVEEMDSLYYKEELSEIEIQLLPFLKQSTRDYPLGMKRLFWLNPLKFVDFLKEIYRNKDIFQSGSVGKSIYYETEFLFGYSCFIPKDYLTQNADELNRWFSAIMAAIEKEQEDLVRFVKKTIASIFSNCPSSSESIWPPKPVADLLEKLANTIEDLRDISTSFSISFSNRRGAINVDDGTAEFALANKYREYADFYSETHKVTSKALYDIADSFASEGENFKKDNRH